MRLLFVIKFGTSDRWGEVGHQHTVGACENLDSVKTLLNKLRLQATKTMTEKFPEEKKRHDAYLGASEGGTDLDPQFQVMDGYWNYFVEPVVEFEVEEALNRRDHLCQAMQMEAKGWELVRQYFPRKNQDSEKAENLTLAPALEQTTSLGAALKKAMTPKEFS